MVASCVIEELDRHKSSTNQRRRDRARLGLRLIEKASLAPDFTLVLREEPVRVRVIISREPPFNWAAHPNLDPAKPDDQLVAEVISFGDGAEIFSHDTGPRIRARIANVQAYEPPAEWLLPVEQTDDKRKITELERDLERLLSRSPKILAGFDEVDEATSEIRLIRPVVPPLDPKFAQQLADQYLAKHPRASLPPPDNPTMEWIGGISQGDVRHYCDKYSSFEAKVHGYFARLHETVRQVGTAAAIRYSVKNDSGVAAEGLRIEFDLQNGGSLLADRDDASFLIGSFEMPEPPKEPQRMPDYLRSMSRYIPTLEPPRDPVAFYWFNRPRIGATLSALQCQDFRAMREFHDCIFVLPSDDLLVDPVIHLHVEATNLPRPVDVTAKLTFAEKAVEWDDTVVQALLPDSIGMA